MFSNENYLGDLLVEAGNISAEQLSVAHQAKTSTNGIIDYLYEHTNITELDVAHVLAHASGMDFINISDIHLEPAVIQSVDDELAKRYRFIPLQNDGIFMSVAIDDPTDFQKLDTLPHALSRQITFYCATRTDISNYLQSLYNATSNEVTSLTVESGISINTSDKEANDDGDAPIIRLVFDTLTEAFRLKVSDIHIEPLETSVRVRYRMDGKLVEICHHPKKLLPAIIARIKVMSGSMSIAEKRLPQDGRIQIKMGDRDVDLRVSTVPSNHGESVVMRILDKSSLMLGLPELGFFSDDQDAFNRLLGLPDGIILVTGPTGSGKTTTLYACLNVINRPDKKIITVEDPVEYQLSGINQVMVKAEVGMTFAAALRAMLRQAPNIIMIGEIRDEETANIAINASLTGHLVFSTLHTNDAPSAVARLADIGVKPFLIASAMRAVLAQRLVRKLCPHCKRPTELTDKEIKSLSLDPSRFVDTDIFGARGCDKCRNNGYRGRIGLFELFKIDDEVRQMINKGLTTLQLRRRARESGMRTLREDGIRKMLAGLTTASEVIHSSSSQ